MNARGILPATQQVLVVLLCLPGEWGTYPGQGVPTLVGEYLPWMKGVLTLAGGTYLGQGYLLRTGVPNLAEGTWKVGTPPPLLTAGR